jgi:hypothetical protein
MEFRSVLEMVALKRKATMDMQLFPGANAKSANALKHQQDCLLLFTFV